MWPVIGLGASLLMLAYVYGGYLVVLRVLVWMQRARGVGGRPSSSGVAESSAGQEMPGVTVYVSAYNEEDRISRRIENLLAQDFPDDRLEIIVISDGSTDGTAGVVRRMMRENPDRDLRLIVFDENRGQAAAQNLVAQEAKYDVLLSTDADTIFEDRFLTRVARQFSDPQVGVVGGTLVYRDLDSDISDSIQQYWGYELALREAEQELGVLTKVSGMCAAYRRGLWSEIEDFEDVDRVVVLFARKQGFRALHLTDTLCFDTPNHDWRQEIRVRRRMTRKGILTILHRWGLGDALRHPMFTFALYSHKVARYPTPLYLLIGAISGLALLHHLAGIVVAALVAAALSLGSAVAVLAPSGSGAGSWILSRMKSFMLANVGFAWGGLDVLAGNREGSYKPTRQLVSDQSTGDE